MPADRTPPNRNSDEDDNAYDITRRRLELELEKIRSEASAARLEARAAEIELMIQGLSPIVRIDPEPSNDPSDTTSAPYHYAAGNSDATRRPPLANQTVRIASWDQLRGRTGGAAPSRSASVVPPTDSAAIEPLVARHQPTRRIDSAKPNVPRPRMLDFEPATDRTDDQDDRTKSSLSDHSVVLEQPDTDVPATSDNVPVAGRPSGPVLVLDQDDPNQPPPTMIGEVAIDTIDDVELEDELPRRRPAALLFSAIAHVAVILILAAVSIQVQRPKDQVALAGSAVEANEVSMETFEMEASEQPETEPTEPTPSAVEYELSPVGELAAAEFSPDAPPAPPSPAAQMMKSTTSQSSAAMSLKSDSKAKIQFCGVEGGGNHFVYLVDCSKSMKEGFQTARMELLSSIEALSPKQRFYVVFFDAKPDYMRLSDANVDEPRSVDATPENKRALKQWAMRVSMDRGRAPYDPLRFALELKPDVIFLLSDGEFPQSIEDLLVEENRVENLFGETTPISIVHTISYHSQEGETRMRRIAQQHGGQYRYVPKP